MARTKMVNGVSVALTSEEEAARDAEEAVWAAGGAARMAEETRRASIHAETNGDAIIDHLKTLTASDIDDWFTANITNAAQAITLLKKLTKIVILKLL